MYCKHCGNAIPEDSKFCPECGAAVREDAPSVEKQDRQRSAEPPVWMQGQEIEEPGKIHGKGEGKKKGLLWLLAALICLYFVWEAYTSGSTIAAGIAALQAGLFILAWMFGGHIWKRRNALRRLLALAGCLLIIPFLGASGSAASRQHVSSGTSHVRSLTERKAQTEAPAAETDSEMEKLSETGSGQEAASEAETQSERPEQTEQETQTPASSADVPEGVNPDLKAFLDSYEAFMNEYIEFMSSYDASSSSVTMLLQYAELMKQYADFAEKVDAYDTDDMSNEDAAYYLEVIARVQANLIRSLPDEE